MKNSKLRRGLTMMACAVLLVCLSVGATLAYLTSTTGIVENTFTVGKVQFEDNDPNTPGVQGGLDEAEVDEYGENDNGTRTDKNEYKIVPNHTYKKDPTVHIAKGSESCFVFVRLNKTDLEYAGPGGLLIDIEAPTTDEGYDTIFEQIDANWELIAADGDGYVFVYEKIVNTTNDTEDARDLVVFNEFKVAADATVPASEDEDVLNAMLDALKITITAYAVQADGFAEVKTNDAIVDIDEAKAAWAATFIQAPNTWYPIV